MKQGEADLSAGLKRGLRRFENSPRNSEWLLECFNLAPAEDGLEAHESIVGLGEDDIEWGGQGVYSPTAILRNITIRVTDYVDSTELESVTVYLDGISKGDTDSNGELDIVGVSVGGHELKLTKTGYLDSDNDTLFNDYISVI